MSAPAVEGGQDCDDILGFPGDGFKDKDDTDPVEVREPVVDDGDSQINEESTDSGQSTVKKRKTTVPIPPDDFVVDRIKSSVNGYSSSLFH
jgi:hypothetical protein